MTDLRIAPRELPMPGPAPAGLPRPAEGPSFGDVLKQSLSEVNQLQLQADASIERLARGEVQDVHQVMIAAEEAGVAFELVMEIRNRLMEAYQDLMRMGV